MIRQRAYKYFCDRCGDEFMTEEELESHKLNCCRCDHCENAEFSYVYGWYCRLGEQEKYNTSDGECAAHKLNLSPLSLEDEERT